MDYGLFPDSFTRYAPGELEELLLEFGRASYPVLQRAGFDSLVLYLLNLLQTYAWPVPSDTQSLVPDVSLFDHLRSTAAIAGCLYLFHEAKGTLDEGSLKDTDKEAFLLAAGDLSGIQSYIFDVATGDEMGSGVARRLRARSLFVQLLSTVASHHVLRRLPLPPTHLLMASGGEVLSAPAQSLGNGGRAGGDPSRGGHLVPGGITGRDSHEPGPGPLQRGTATIDCQGGRGIRRRHAKGHGRPGHS